LEREAAEWDAMMRNGVPTFNPRVRIGKKYQATIPDLLAAASENSNSLCNQDWKQTTGYLNQSTSMRNIPREIYSTSKLKG